MLKVTDTNTALAAEQLGWQYSSCTSTVQEYRTYCALNRMRCSAFARHLHSKIDQPVISIYPRHIASKFASPCGFDDPRRVTLVIIAPVHKCTYTVHQLVPSQAYEASFCWPAADGWTGRARTRSVLADAERPFPRHTWILNIQQPTCPTPLQLSSYRCVS